MEQLKTWAGTLIAFSVIVLLFRMLFPQGNIKKAGETVIALMLVFLAAQPLFSLWKEGRSKTYDFAVYDFFAEGESSTERQLLADTILAKLRAAGIAATGVSLDAELDEENYLIVRALTIAVPTGTSAQAIYDCLRSQFEIPQEIITISEE